MALARTASCANCRQTVIPGAVSDAKEPREHSLEALCREASSMQEMEGVASGVVRRARRKSAESKRRATGPGKPRAVQNARGASGETSATGEPLEKRIEDFIAAAREDILARTRTIVAERSFPRASCDEIENGLPLLLDQVSERLCRSHPNGAVASGAAKHGRELLQMGMSVTHVVHDFADIRRAVVDLAAQVNSSLAVTELLAIDRALDDVVAHTVAEYSRQRERAAAREAAERLGVVAHETRNHLGTAMLAFSSLEEGRGDAQRSRAILGRSLRRLMNLVERSFAEVRLESGVRRPQQVSISNLVGEIARAAAMDAEARGQRLTVTDDATGVEVQADREILGDAVVNLVQNAFKFTRPNGHVHLTARAVDDRVVIEVDDECGGLPGADHEHLFRPFAQQHADGRGLGLGLAISRRGVESSGGRLFVRNRPGVGCCFVVELPRQVGCPS